jgi:hypothetical protein
VCICTDRQTKKDVKWGGVVKTRLFMLLLLFFVIEVGFNPCQHGVLHSDKDYTSPSPILNFSLSSLSFFVAGNVFVCISKPTTEKSTYFFAYFCFVDHRVEMYSYQKTFNKRIKQQVKLKNIHFLKGHMYC